jgi:DNA polymerase-1
MLESHKEAKETGQVKSMFGRPRRIPDAKKITRIYGNIQHSDLPYEARQLLNLSVNHRVQSSAASLVNRAMVKLYEDMKTADIDAKFVSQIHDEIVVECKEQDAPSVSLLMQSAMELTTVLEGVPLEAVPSTKRTLAK